MGEMMRKGWLNIGSPQAPPAPRPPQSAMHMQRAHLHKVQCKAVGGRLQHRPQCRLLVRAVHVGDAIQVECPRQASRRAAIAAADTAEVGHDPARNVRREACRREARQWWASQGTFLGAAPPPPFKGRSPRVCVFVCVCATLQGPPSGDVTQLLRLFADLVGPLVVRCACAMLQGTIVGRCS